MQKLKNPVEIKHPTKAVLAFAAIYVIWGSTYLAIRYAVETIPPLLMMGTRSLTAGAVLFAVSRARGHEGPKREHYLSLLIIGTSFFLVGHGLLAWAEQKVPSGLAALLVGSEPCLIGIIEWIFIRDHKLSFRGIGGLILGFIGIALLVSPSKELGTSQTDVLGAFAIILGTLSWSGGAVYSRVARLPKSPMVSAGLELMIGGVLLLVAGFVTGETGALHAVSMHSVLALLYLIVFGSIIAFSAYVWLLTHTSATRISTHTYINPVFALVLGWALAGESMTLGTILATCIIVVSIYLVLSDRAHTEVSGASFEVPDSLDEDTVRNSMN
ncbi:MAG TPA: EamA family transporter [Bacteroidota bacterium]